jgi:hypothetical protein
VNPLTAMAVWPAARLFLYEDPAKTPNTYLHMEPATGSQTGAGFFL